MRLQKRRLERLEAFIGAITKEPTLAWRVVVSAIARPLNLEKSRCTRTLGSDGRITEFVLLDGSRDYISDEELDRFVASFPVVGRTSKEVRITRQADLAERR